MTVKLNNAAECLGYLCLFVAMNDGELHEEESKRTMGAMAHMITGLKIDVDGDGVIDHKDLSISYKHVLSQIPNDDNELNANFLSIIKDYFGGWNKSDKEIIVDHLAGVAKADNVIQEVEKSNVNLVAEMFDVKKPF